MLTIHSVCLCLAVKSLTDAITAKRKPLLVPLIEHSKNTGKRVRPCEQSDTNSVGRKVKKRVKWADTDGVPISLSLKSTRKVDWVDTPDVSYVDYCGLTLDASDLRSQRSLVTWVDFEHFLS